jgi:hypothetical protein
MIFGQRSDHFFPSERLVRQCCHRVFHNHFTSRFHYQFRVRFLHREEVESISKIVRSFGDRRRGWLDVQFAPFQPVPRKRARLETRNVVPDRDRILVLVSGSMN